MTDQPPTPEIYGHLTGRKRLAIMLSGALSGLAVAIMFAFFAQRSVTTIELIIGAVIGAILGLSASLGEQRRKRTKPD
jgi:uncharacterized membrane protein YqgA involved in biofilm formation